MQSTFLRALLGIGLVLMSFCYAESIYPITREAGSGTRGAFVEIFATQKQVGNKKVDAISNKAEVTNSTGVMITTVANLKGSIGYISLGSLNDTVKALKIDGVEASVDNIINKSYAISRPFNVVTKKLTPASEDFLKYATSKEVENIIQKAGYIPQPTASFTSKKPSGKVIVAGSSSITPLMEKLAESYKQVNPNATIEIQQSDSTTGINSTIEGIADIGMVSRDVKESETKKGISTQILALDGLAVIVNKNNQLDSISKDTVKKIFLGEVNMWEEIK